MRDPEANIIDPDSTGVIELYRQVRSTKFKLLLSEAGCGGCIFTVS